MQLKPLNITKCTNRHLDNKDCSNQIRIVRLLPSNSNFLLPLIFKGLIVNNLYIYGWFVDFTIFKVLIGKFRKFIDWVIKLKVWEYDDLTIYIVRDLFLQFSLIFSIIEPKIIKISFFLFFFKFNNYSMGLEPSPSEMIISILFTRINVKIMLLPK